ncbi:hypothetical protein [Amycolatopsis sp. NPDC059021]|uniref:hypothetical protein n=1 Tax=Amycolatopsis sp. NPDC059021 TaxID=3346704 RepID=UPI00366DA6B1
MKSKTIAREELGKSDVKSALRTVKTLVGLYTALSLLTLVAIILLRNRADLVTDAVWIRGTIVAVTALLMFSFAIRTGQGRSRAFLRLRLVSGIMLVAIVVIIALPGAFPTWMKIEQGVCGLLLLGVVFLVNGPRLRSVFSGK